MIVSYGLFYCFQYKHRKPKIEILLSYIYNTGHLTIVNEYKSFICYTSFSHYYSIKTRPTLFKLKAISELIIWFRNVLVQASSVLHGELKQNNFYNIYLPLYYMY